MWHKALKVNVLVIVAVLVLGALPASAQTGDGVFRGKLINFTEGGNSVAFVEILLNIYDESERIGAATSVTDEEGSFEFTELATESTYVYQPELTYQGAEYRYQWFSFAEEEHIYEQDLPVYDSTSSDEAIRIDIAHIIVKAEQGGLLVSEYYQFVNDANTTYIGSVDLGGNKMETLRFSLPEEATNVQWQEGLMECCALMTTYGFMDTMAVYPGGKEILFAYSLPYNNGSYNLPMTLFYPLNTMHMFVQGKQIDVESRDLTREAPSDAVSSDFTRYTAQNLERGSILDIRFSTEGSSSLKIIIPVAVAIIIGAGFIVWIRMRQRPSIAPEKADSVSDEERLLREIAQLDDDFERGDINEGDYERQRSQKKALLIELRRRRSGNIDGSL